VSEADQRERGQRELSEAVVFQSEYQKMTVMFTALVKVMYY